MIATYDSHITLIGRGEENPDRVTVRADFRPQGFLPCFASPAEACVIKCFHWRYGLRVAAAGLPLLIVMQKQRA